MTHDIHRLVPLTDCRSCGAAIVFLRTAAGRSMPVDAIDVLPDDTTYDAKRHVSHFATCPEAKLWRKPKETP